MKYAIVYRSQTGNTQLLAETIRSFLPKEDCLYFGPPNPQALQAERIYIGFWTDKGTCDAEIAKFLSQITTQTIFLFGTAGFGGATAYFEKILATVQKNIISGSPPIGVYMCQGKMPFSVRQRYEAMEEGPRKQAMLDNFDQAKGHPNTDDLKQLKAAILSVK